MLIGLNGIARSGKDTAADYLVDTYGFTRIAFADPIKRIVQDIFDFTDEQLWGDKKEVPDTRYPKMCEECNGIGTFFNSVSNTYGIPSEFPPQFEYTNCSECGGKGVIYLIPRKSMQFIGTEMVRELYSQTWVEYLFRITKSIPLGHYTNLHYSKKKGLRTLDSMHIINGFAISDVRFINEIFGIKERGGVVIKIVRDAAGLDEKLSKHQSESEQATVPDAEFDHIIYNNSSLLHLYEELDKIVDVMKTRANYHK